MIEISAYLSETKDIVLHRKYQTHYLSILDHTNRAISKMLNVTPDTITAYNTRGIEALVPLKSTGRPAFMTP